jgi:hypothetical protein
MSQVKDATYSLELIRRATIERDHAAWVRMQLCFGGMVHTWLRLHPSQASVLRLESEENLVAQAFERFWQVTALTQRMQFNRLPDALKYLRASLNGAILDTLRAYASSRAVTIPEPGAHEEPFLEKLTSSEEAWNLLQTVLLNEREQRLAYLLYHCGLGPREIIRCYPQEWSNAQEIYRLRHNILKRLLGIVEHQSMAGKAET